MPAWQKTDKPGAIIEEDDATQGNENVEGGDNTNNPGSTNPTSPTDPG